MQMLYQLRSSRRLFLNPDALWPWLVSLSALLCASIAFWAVPESGPESAPLAAIGQAGLTHPFATAQGLDATTRAQWARLAVGIVVGAALGLAGAMWQAIRREPYGCPHLAGLSSGAALGAALGHLWAPAVFGGPVGRALWHLGAAVAGCGAVLLAHRLGTAMQRGSPWASGAPTKRVPYPRAGVGLLVLLGSATAWLLHRHRPADAATQTFWLFGDLGGNIGATHAVAAVALGLVVSRLRPLHAQVAHVAVGPLWARQAGVAVGQVCGTALGAVCVLVSASVVMVGNVMGISFLAPLLARASVGAMPGRSWPTAGIYGALLVVWADGAVQHLGRAEPLPLVIVLAPMTGACLLWAAWVAPRRAGVEH